MILIDENVPKSVYTELKRRGYDVKHVIFIKRGLKDREIIDLANREGRIIITLDEDFVHLSRFLKTKVILIRKKIEKRKIDSLVDTLERVFNIEGKVIIIREDFIEVFY
jgi:predicted nuclease of predicted toxin-antitoxin system